MNPGAERTALLFFLLILAMPTASAETVKGRVVSVDPDSGAIVMEAEPVEGSDSGAQTVFVSVGRETRVSGVMSLDDLGIGDEIRVRGRRADSVLEARYLSVLTPLNAAAGTLSFNQDIRAASRITPPSDIRSASRTGRPSEIRADSASAGVSRDLFVRNE